MTDFDPDPAGEQTDELRQRWSSNTDIFGRVYGILVGITRPTSYREIADIADCSPNAAKKHLDRVTELGIARANRQSRPAQYQRNDGLLRMAGREPSRQRVHRRGDYRPRPSSSLAIRWPIRPLAPSSSTFVMFSDCR